MLWIYVFTIVDIIFDPKNDLNSGEDEDLKRILKLQMEGNFSAILDDKKLFAFCSQLENDILTYKLDHGGIINVAATELIWKSHSSCKISKEDLEFIVSIFNTFNDFVECVRKVKSFELTVLNLSLDKSGDEAIAFLRKNGLAYVFLICHLREAAYKSGMDLPGLPVLEHSVAVRHALVTLIYR